MALASRRARRPRIVKNCVVPGINLRVLHTTQELSGGEAGTQLLRNLDSFVVRQASDAAQQRREILAVYKFHGKKKPALTFADIIDTTDVGVRDLPRHAHFGVELIAPA